MTDEVSDILDTAIEAIPQTRKEIMAEWTDKVNDAWKSAKKSVYQSVFDIGDLLVQAKEELSDNEFSGMVTGSILESRSNALAYMRVARKDCLREEAIFRHLPLKVGVLIDLGCETWTREHIVQAITEGVINPNATRSKIQQWMEKQRIVDDHIETEDTSFPEGVGIAGTQSTTLPEGPPKRQTPNLNTEKPYHQNPRQKGQPKSLVTISITDEFTADDVKRIDGLLDMCGSEKVSAFWNDKLRENIMVDAKDPEAYRNKNIPAAHAGVSNILSEDYTLPEQKDHVYDIVLIFQLDDEMGSMSRYDRIMFANHLQEHIQQGKIKWVLADGFDGLDVDAMQAFLQRVKVTTVRADKLPIH
jgi:hypothetical protein